jgi:O-antigen ligase
MGFTKPTGEGDRFAFVMSVLFVIAMFASIVNVFPALEVLRPALLTSGLSALALVLGRVARRAPFIVDGARGLAFAGFGALALGSSAWSVAPEASRREAFELAKMLAFYFTLVNLAATAGRVRVLCMACVLASLAPSVGAILRYLDGVDLVEGYRARWLGLYADPNHLAMALVAVVPMGASAVVFGRSRFLRALSLVAGGLAVAAIVLTHSRGGALGLALALTLWAMTGPRKGPALGAVMAVLVAVALFAPRTFWERTGSVADFHADASALGRVHAWEVAEGVSRDRPLIGVGVGAFVRAWRDYAPEEARHTAFVAHNVFLAVLAELGVVGLVLFLVLVGGALAGAARALRAREVGPWARGVLAGYILCDMLSGYLASTHFFFLTALAACCGRAAVREVPTATLSLRAEDEVSAVTTPTLPQAR